MRACLTRRVRTPGAHRYRRIVARGVAECAAEPHPFRRVRAVAVEYRVGGGLVEGQAGPVTVVFAEPAGVGDGRTPCFGPVEARHPRGQLDRLGVHVDSPRPPRRASVRSWRSGAAAGADGAWFTRTGLGR
ncbi:hypothetical protein WP39_04260 [Streptomyces sp. 604F]|nr:hypothetical protein [Streptomyces sp. 604F]